MIDMTALAGVVQAFATGPLVVARPGTVQIVSGRRVNGSTAPVTGVIGSVWPIAGDSASLSNDGRRQDNSADIYCLQALQIADDSIAQPGDIVTHLGIDYEIVAQQKWVRGAFFVYSGKDINHP